MERDTRCFTVIHFDKDIPMYCLLPENITRCGRDANSTMTGTGAIEKSKLKKS